MLLRSSTHCNVTGIVADDESVPKAVANAKINEELTNHQE